MYTLYDLPRKVLNDEVDGMVAIKSMCNVINKDGLAVTLDGKKNAHY